MPIDLEAIEARASNAERITKNKMCPPPLAIAYDKRADDIDALLAEVRRLRAERRKVFDMISEWQTPLFQLRMQTIAVQGIIDREIHALRKAWLDEHDPLMPAAALEADKEPSS